MKNIVLNLIKKMKRASLSYRDDAKGTVAVEFALVAVAFLSLIFGTLEVGRLLFTWNAVQYTVEQAARVALITPDVTEAQIRQFVIDELPPALVRPDDFDISVTYSVVGGVNFVELQGLYNYRAITPFMPDGWFDFQLPATSRIVLPN